MPHLKKHFKTIAELNQAYGFPPPDHPMLCVRYADRIESSNMTFSNDFYSIAIKNIISGELHYGRTQYDFTQGSMMFTAPRQEVSCENVVTSSDVVMLLFHEDFIRGHELSKTIRQYGFFSYAVNEALHLSAKEESHMRLLLKNIHQEYESNQDEFSKSLLLSQLDTLLKYANRYYKRQFLNRVDISNQIMDRFDKTLHKYFEKGTSEWKGTPKVEEIASEMRLSSRYLSDTLKAETGKTALEHIHLYLLDEAKNLLLKPEMTVAEVAYQLGFEYPQYFSRLFKKKIGLSPKDYRNQKSIH